MYTDNQKLRGRVAKLTEEAEAREQELQELRELVDLEIDRAAASMAAEEETWWVEEALLTGWLCRHTVSETGLLRGVHKMRRTQQTRQKSDTLTHSVVADV